MIRSASLSQEDQRVIQLFTYREKGQSKSMNSTGDRLDGPGPELKGVAFWENDQIWFVEKGSRTGQQIHKLIKKLNPYPEVLGGYKKEAPMLVMRRSASEVLRSLEQRVASLEAQAARLVLPSRARMKGKRVGKKDLSDLLMEFISSEYMSGGDEFSSFNLDGDKFSFQIMTDDGDETFWAGKIIDRGVAQSALLSQDSYALEDAVMVKRDRNRDSGFGYR